MKKSLPYQRWDSRMGWLRFLFGQLDPKSPTWTKRQSSKMKIMPVDTTVQAYWGLDFKKTLNSSAGLTRYCKDFTRYIMYQICHPQFWKFRKDNPPPKYTKHAPSYVGLRETLLYICTLLPPQNNDNVEMTKFIGNLFSEGYTNQLWKKTESSYTKRSLQSQKFKPKD